MARKMKVRLPIDLLLGDLKAIKKVKKNMCKTTGISDNKYTNS